MLGIVISMTIAFQMGSEISGVIYIVSVIFTITMLFTSKKTEAVSEESEENETKNN